MKKHTVSFRNTLPLSRFTATQAATARHIDHVLMRATERECLVTSGRVQRQRVPTDRNGRVLALEVFDEQDMERMLPAIVTGHTYTDVFESTPDWFMDTSEEYDGHEITDDEIEEAIRACDPPEETPEERAHRIQLKLWELALPTDATESVTEAAIASCKRTWGRGYPVTLEGFDATMYAYGTRNREGYDLMAFLTAARDVAATLRAA